MEMYVRAAAELRLLRCCANRFAERQCDERCRGDWLSTARKPLAAAYVVARLCKARRRITGDWTGPLVGLVVQVDNNHSLIDRLISWRPPRGREGRGGGGGGGTSRTSDALPR